ncbi:fucolectin-1-like [Haliotis asinina]|uniref:fucolectin-1-like n=1 Tax=Haliotis asinina TaxID=109174 RepID=UPI00353233EA
MYHFLHDIRYLVIVVNSLISTVFASACTFEIVQYGKRLSGSAFNVLGMSTLFSCAAECASYRLCKSFNVDVDQHTCTLNEKEDIGDLRNSPATIYSRIDSWNTVSLTPCQGVHCGYGERCVDRKNGEVECEYVLQNVALNKAASASSVWNDKNPPGAAVNGNVSAIWAPGNCFHVDNDDYTPWWQVDLLTTCIIVEVRITTRSTLADRLHDFALDVYRKDLREDTDVKAQLCFMYNGAVTEGGKTVALPCTSPVTGRYLRIRGTNTLDTQDVLQFCEVQVFAFRILYW